MEVWVAQTLPYPTARIVVYVNLYPYTIPIHIPIILYTYYTYVPIRIYPIPIYLYTYIPVY
jgi:hypothetical protein